MRVILSTNLQQLGRKVRLSGGNVCQQLGREIRLNGYI